MMARPLVAPRGTAVVSTLFVSTFILFVLALEDVGWKDKFWYVCHTAVYMDVLNMSFIFINYGKVGKEDKADYALGRVCLVI